MSEWIVTRHALKRIRQRLGLPKKAVAKLVCQAQLGALSARDVSGSLRRYMDHFQHNAGTSDHVVIYEQWVFLLKGKTLITIIPLPHKYRRKKAVSAGSGA